MASPAVTVLHTSDLQCGRPFVPRAAEALVRLARDVEPDVIVAAGDLTQRAKAREFRAATQLLARLPEASVVVTPGNHDVPLYRFWERLFDPYRNWRRFVSPDLDTVTRVEGATFVALNSTAPRRAIVNGRLDDDQVDFARRVFEPTGPAELRVVVVHHHFVPVPSREGGSPLPRARQCVAAFEDMGVDLVLGGHVHQIHVSTSRDLLPDREAPGVPLVACGTTTSRRGRGAEEGWQSLHVIRVDEASVEVTPHRLGPDAADFQADGVVSFPRTPRRTSFESQSKTQRQVPATASTPDGVR